MVQTGLKPSLNEADEIPGMCHCDQIQFLFKKTICRLSAGSYAEWFFILASETLSALMTYPTAVFESHVFSQVAEAIMKASLSGVLG